MKKSKKKTDLYVTKDNILVGVGHVVAGKSQKLKPVRERTKAKKCVGVCKTC